MSLLFVTLDTDFYFVWLIDVDVYLLNFIEVL